MGINADTGATGAGIVFTPAQINDMTPEEQEALHAVEEMMISEEVGPNGEVIKTKRNMSELSDKEVEELAKNLDTLSVFRGADEANLAGTLDKIKMAQNLGVPLDWDLVDSFSLSSVVHLPVPVDFDPEAYPQANSMINNLAATTIFMTMYLKIMAEKEHKGAMEELLISAIEVFRSYVKEIAKHIIDIGKMKAMEHITKAVTQGLQAGNAGYSGVRSVRTRSKVHNQIQAEKKQIRTEVTEGKDGQSGMLREYDQAGGVGGNDPNYRHDNSMFKDNSTGNPFNYNSDRVVRGKPVTDADGNTISNNPKEGDVDAGNPAAQAKKKEIDDKVKEHNGLDKTEGHRVQQELMVEQARKETFSLMLGSLGELAQAGIAIEQSELEAEKALIEGAKELQSRLIDMLTGALNDSKDVSSKDADMLYQWITQQGQAFGLGAAPRG